MSNSLFEDHGTNASRMSRFETKLKIRRAQISMFFLKYSDSRRNLEVRFHLFIWYSIRTLCWFTHLKNPSGYPVATSTTDVGKTVKNILYKFLNEKDLILSTNVKDQWYAIQ